MLSVTESTKENASNAAGSGDLEDSVRKHEKLRVKLDRENSKLAQLNKPHDSRKPFEEIDRILNIASVDAFIDDYSKRQRLKVN